MERWTCAQGVATTLFMMATTLSAALASAENHPAERGRALFTKTWQPSQAPAPKPDGLGPMFNERSCIACHGQGGIGGAGPSDKNVELLTPAVVAWAPPAAEFTQRLRKIHPAFADASTIVLHKYSTRGEPYSEFRSKLLEVEQLPIKPRLIGNASIGSAERMKAPRMGPPRGGSPNKTVRVDGVQLVSSQRNTPPLFGLGRIQRISPAAIRAVASQQPLENRTVSGRFTGRFGWRGQIDQLDNFVHAACANELGLSVGINKQAVDPLADPESAVTHDADLTFGQAHDLMAFVSQLPMPRQILPRDRPQARQIEHGEELFNRVGCAVCHRRTLAQVVGLYSDLLIHDMGEQLADPSPAPAGSTAVRPRRTAGGAYGVSQAQVRTGSAPISLDERKREWKTPPLWGLRDSGPYLHDGRAETIEEAISWHGGEAAGSVQLFQALPAQEQSAVLDFLKTLAAPDPANLR